MGFLVLRQPVCTLLKLLQTMTTCFLLPCEIQGAQLWPLLLTIQSYVFFLWYKSLCLLKSAVLLLQPAFLGREEIGPQAMAACSLGAPVVHAHIQGWWCSHWSLSLRWDDGASHGCFTSGWNGVLHLLFKTIWRFPEMTHKSSKSWMTII